MAQRHGLPCTTKALRMDYTRLKKRLPACNQTIQPEPSAFVELLAPPATGPMEYVVEWESARGRMRVATKGSALDWGSLLRATCAATRGRQNDRGPARHGSLFPERRRRPPLRSRAYGSSGPLGLGVSICSMLPDTLCSPPVAI